MTNRSILCKSLMASMIIINKIIIAQYKASIPIIRMEGIITTGYHKASFQLQQPEINTIHLNSQNFRISIQPLLNMIALIFHKRTLVAQRWLFIDQQEMFMRESRCLSHQVLNIKPQERLIIERRCLSHQVLKAEITNNISRPHSSVKWID